MKQLWIGVGFLAVMLAAGILLSVLFVNIYTPLHEGLEQASALSLAGDWEGARQALARCRKDWQKYRHFVAAVADHEPLEEMETYLAQLAVYAHQENAGEFAALCARTAGLAHAMSESQQLTWWNLL